MLNVNMQKRCYFGCTFNPPLHSFPSPFYPNEERFARWKSILNEDIINRGDKYIHRNVRLCARHFEEKYKTRGRRLTLNSYPTLHLSFETATTPVPATLPSVESTVSTSPSFETATAPVPVPATLPSLESAVSTLPLPVHPQVAVFTQENERQNENQTSSSSVQDIAIQSGCQESKKLKKRKLFSSITKKSKELAKLKVKLLKAKAKCKTFSQRVRKAEKIVKSKYFIKTIEQLPEPAFLFTKMQQQFNKQARGRRFSIKEKVLALTLFKQSQKAYNLMRKLFVLPSKRTLQKTLNLIPLKAGINDFIIKNLRETVKKFSDEKKLCTLIFDEVALTPGLYYNKYYDKIEGFEDFGDKTTGRIADHALVFMIKGIKSKYKQPICFTYCQSSTKKDQLKTLIKKVITQLTATGLKIIATICDQGGPNMSAINSLVAETKEKYERNKEEYRSLAFEVDDIKVFPIYDPPHLLKGIRNNLINKRLRYIQNGNVKFANWDHLRLLLDIDIGDDDDDDTRFCNKITELHINEEKIPKMKVKYAAQIFSQRVSSSLRFVAKHKLLPPECTETADLLLIMDKLFDSFNGHSYKEQDKKYKNCLKKHSPHHHLWDELSPILRSMQFEVIRKNKERKYEQVPSIKNWIHNIKVVKELFNYLNTTFNITSLLTRNLNQDPLENFFCCIRSHGVRNISPTCSQFNSAYKTLLVNNFSSAHAVGANCESDINKPLQSLQHLLMSTSNEPQSVEEEHEEHESQLIEIDNIIDLLRDEESVSLISDESKRYVGGYIIKKCRKIYGKCKICNKDVSTKPTEDSYTFARDYTKNSLNYPSNAMHKCISEILKLTNRTLSVNPQNKNTIENIKLIVQTTCDFSFLTCSIHKEKLSSFFVRLAIIINVHSWCTCVNRILKGKISKFNKEDVTKVQADKYYNTHKNRKNKK